MTSGSAPPSVPGPVIVVGMHRSGTTAVARVLDALGVDMGRGLDPNHEPRTYMALNDWILRQAGTTWEFPLEISRLIDCPSQLEHTVRAVSSGLRAPAVRLSHRSRRSGRHRARRWGWKDPRNTATLPLWRRIFPDARVVAVVRHGVPVAASLVRRHQTGDHRPRLRHRALAPLRPGPFVGCRTGDLEQALAMWNDYNQLVGAMKADPGLSVGGRLLSVGYEELITNPESVVVELAKFIDIDPEPVRLSVAVSLIATGDPYNFRRSGPLRELEAANAEMLLRHGYTAPSEQRAATTARDA